MKKKMQELLDELEEGMRCCTCMSQEDNVDAAMITIEKIRVEVRILTKQVGMCKFLKFKSLFSKEKT